MGMCIAAVLLWAACDANDHNNRLRRAKSVFQVHGVAASDPRHLFIRQQTSAINAIRAHLAKLGSIAQVGRNGVEELLLSSSFAALL
jgi:transposase